MSNTVWFWPGMLLLALVGLSFLPELLGQTGVLALMLRLVTRAMIGPRR